MRVREFIPMASPLIVGFGDGPVVALAFVIGEDWELGAFVVTFDGGTPAILPMTAVTFPAPIRTGPAATSTTTIGRGARRAERFRKGIN